MTHQRPAAAIVADAQAAIAAHGKLCNICTQLTRTRARYCGPGWILQEDLLAAKRIARAAKAAASAQGALF